MDTHLGVQHEMLGQVTQHQLAVLDQRFGRGQADIVHRHRQGLQRLAIQPQRGVGRRLRATTVLAGSGDHRIVGVQAEMQHHAVDLPVGGPVVLAAHHGGLGQGRISRRGRLGSHRRPDLGRGLCGDR